VVSWYQEVIKHSAAFGLPTVCKSMELLEPGFRTALVALLAHAKGAGHELRVLETYRSPTRQEALYKAGATQLKSVGVHSFGLAVDLGLFLGGKYVQAAAPYNFLVNLAAKYQMISGINWGHDNKKATFVDAGHLQRVPVFRQPDLFAERWYPPRTYDPRLDMLKHGVK